MKKIVLFLFLLLAVSCTYNIDQTCKVDDLSRAEQLILSQTDTSLYMNAIIIDDKVLIFEDPAKDIIRVTNYIDPGLVFFTTLILVIILILILAYIFD
jgi:hypothetical protein